MRVDTLSTALARTADVRSAAWELVTHLEGPGRRPSVYVERGGRLRCQALSGYRQLLDGMPPWAGIIGRTYATGESNVVQDVRRDPNYLAAADGIVAQACFPVVCHGRTVGAVNLEADRTLSPAEVDEVARAARAFAGKLEAIGGPPPESPSQRLVRHAIALSTQHDVAAIERAVLAAAIDVTPLRSAILFARSTAQEPFLPGPELGTLGPSLVETPPAAVAELASYTSAGCSVYTVPDLEVHDEGGSSTQALRTSGASSMAVLPVGPNRILVVADVRPFALTTEHCERLELLAAQASACLRTAASVSELRTLAETDALTGLGHHASFHAELAEARDAGPVGVLVIDVDRFKEYNDRHGHPAGDRALRATAEVLSGALRRGDALFRIGGDEFAAVLPGVAEETALEVARRLHAAVAGEDDGLQVSIGAAAAAPDEDAAALLARADRALYAVKDRGRDGVALDADG